VAHGDRVEGGTFAVPGRGRVVVVPAELSAVPMEATTVRGDVAGVAAVSTVAPARKVFLDVGLFPPATVNDVAGRPTVNTVSIGFPVSRSDRLEGVAYGLLGHLGGDVRGVQTAGLFTTASESLTGVQVAGLWTSAGPTKGAQVSGLWASSGPLQGVQVSGLAGYADGDASFGQVTGIASLVRGRMEGVQAAGFANYAGSLVGVQVAPVNFSGDVGGLQIGVVNVGRRVSGVQVGIVNVAEDVDVPIGLVSIVKEGRQEVEVFATESNAGNVAVRLGSRRVQSILTAGIAAGQKAGETRWMAGAGLGVALVREGQLTLDLDALGQGLYYGNDAGGDTVRLVATLRPTVAWRLAPRLSLIGSVSANVLVSGDGAHDDVGGWGRDVGTGKNVVRIFPGFSLGVRI
jgi:hypothetical protein